MQDMELLSIFARQAAIAIHASQQYERLGEALVRGLKDLVKTEGGPEIEQVIDRLAERPGEDEGAADLMALADLFKSIYELGEAERKAGLRILAALADYTRSRPRYA